jgi:hypothetical protein
MFGMKCNIKDQIDEDKAELNAATLALQNIMYANSQPELAFLAQIEPLAMANLIIDEVANGSSLYSIESSIAGFIPTEPKDLIDAAYDKVVEAANEANQETRARNIEQIQILIQQALAAYQSRTRNGH